MAHHRLLRLRDDVGRDGALPSDDGQNIAVEWERAVWLGSDSGWLCTVDIPSGIAVSATSTTI